MSTCTTIFSRIVGCGHTYSYNNNLLESNSLSYFYDHTNSRVITSDPTTYTHTPSDLYSVSGPNPVKNIFLGSQLLSTVKGGRLQVPPQPAEWGSGTLTFNHPDHLNSTHVVSDTTAHIAELSDYLPYGTQRVSEHFIQPSSNNLQPTNQKRKYLGEEFDSSTSYNYLNARYYEPGRGKFLSEDPVFWEIGQTKDGKYIMTNPQAANSYSYGEDNPITKKDPQGRLVPEALVGGFVGGIVGGGFQGVGDIYRGSFSGWSAYAGAITGGATFGGIVGATDGLSLLPIMFAGGVSGAVQSGATQGLSIANGSQKGFSYGDLTSQILLSGGTAGIPGFGIAGVTLGRGSFSAIERQMLTKLGNGTVSPLNISAQTYGKMTVSQAAQQAPGAIFQGIGNAIGKFVGTFNFGGSIGTINFGATPTKK